MSGWGDRVARRWTAVYTRGLPDEAASRRREEIASDLHEHACWDGASRSHQVDVLGRVLWGIPADLSWRRAARAPRARRLETGAPSMTLRNVTTGVFAFFILFDLWVSAGLWLGRALGGDAEDGDSAGWQWGVPFLLAAIVLGYALRVRDEHPQRSTVLMIVGATIPMVTFYWMVPIFVPFWLVAAGLAIASEPGRRTPAPAV